MDWVQKYIGVEFEPCGRGPRFDCWGLVWKVLTDEFGYDVPSYDDEYEKILDRAVPRLFAEEAKKWEQVSQPEPGDIVVLRIKGYPWHVGIVIEPGKMLHIPQNINACIEKYNGPLWKKRIEGFYRYRNI